MELSLINGIDLNQIDDIRFVLCPFLNISKECALIIFNKAD